MKNHHVAEQPCDRRKCSDTLARTYRGCSGQPEQRGLDLSCMLIPLERRSISLQARKLRKCNERRIWISIECCLLPLLVKSTSERGTSPMTLAGRAASCRPYATIRPHRERFESDEKELKIGRARKQGRAGHNIQTAPMRKALVDVAATLTHGFFVRFSFNVPSLSASLSLVACLSASSRHESAASLDGKCSSGFLSRSSHALICTAFTYGVALAIGMAAFSRKPCPTTRFSISALRPADSSENACFSYCSRVTPVSCFLRLYRFEPPCECRPIPLPAP